MATQRVVPEIKVATKEPYMTRLLDVTSLRTRLGPTSISTAGFVELSGHSSGARACHAAGHGLCLRLYSFGSLDVVVVDGL